MSVVISFNGILKNRQFFKTLYIINQDYLRDNLGNFQLLVNPGKDELTVDALARTSFTLNI